MNIFGDVTVSDQLNHLRVQLRGMAAPDVKKDGDLAKDLVRACDEVKHAADNEKALSGLCGSPKRQIVMD